MPFSQEPSVFSCCNQLDAMLQADIRQADPEGLAYLANLTVTSSVTNVVGRTVSQQTTARLFWTLGITVYRHIEDTY